MFFICHFEEDSSVAIVDCYHQCRILFSAVNSKIGPLFVLIGSMHLDRIVVLVQILD